ncbi:MAG: ABC-type transport auxiliary lipoprotein family protein [Pseudomonadota bacterium]
MKRIAAAIGALAAAGCVSVLPQPQVPDGLYTVDTTRETPVPLAGTVVVQRPETQKLFAGTALISKSDDGSARVVPGVEWSDNPARLLQIGLLDLFAAQAGGHAVTPTSGASAKYELAWRIADFSVNGAQANVALELTLLNARNRDPIARKLVRTDAATTSNDAPARILALEAAARAALQETAAFVSANAPAA